MSLDVQGKIDIAKEKKEVADQAFRTGEIKDGEWLATLWYGRG
jgi:hypothetical protein